MAKVIGLPDKPDLETTKKEFTNWISSKQITANVLFFINASQPCTVKEITAKMQEHLQRPFDVHDVRYHINQLSSWGILCHKIPADVFGDEKRTPIDLKIEKKYRKVYATISTKFARENYQNTAFYYINLAWEETLFELAKIFNVKTYEDNI